MSSTFYEDLEVESVLSCPVCFEVPSNVVYLCKVGHHMCDKCRKKLTICPTCQSALTGSRNFLAEALISKFSMLKLTEGGADNNDNTSTTVDAVVPPAVVSPTLEDNDKLLKSLLMPPGVYLCLLEACPSKKSWSVGQLYPHVRKVHNHLFEEFKNNTSTFKHNFENFCLVGKGERKYHRAFHVGNMGLFYLMLRFTADNYLNCWLSMAAPVHVTNRFDYQLVFNQEKNNAKEQFISKVASNLQERQWLLERGRVFHLSPSQHKLENSDFFSLNLKIVYKSPGANEETS